MKFHALPGWTILIAASMALAGCMPASPATPTFYEIFPLPNTAEPFITATPDAQMVTATLPATSISPNAPDLIGYVRTSLAPPICLGLHSRAGAYVTVQNQGAGDAGPFMVDVDGIRQSVPTGLAIGEWVNLWFDASPFATPWSTIRVTVDPANQVIETDEANNFVTQFVATLTPPYPCPTATDPPASGSAPDLVAAVYTSLAPPICLGPQSEVGAQVYISNVGTGDAGPFMVDVNGSLMDVPEGLAAGGEKVLWFDLVSFPPPGENLTVTADVLDQVAETNEDNNVTSSPVVVLTPPLPCPTPTEADGS